MIELPGAPVDVTFQDLAFSNNGPYDVLGTRDGRATLVICVIITIPGGSVQALFSAADDPIDATVGIPLDFYNVFEVSSAARYMTLFADGADTVAYWYVV